MDCVLKDGKRVYRLPSESLNYFCTTQEDMAAFSAWAYDASPIATQEALARIKRETAPR